MIGMAERAVPACLPPSSQPQSVSQSESAKCAVWRRRGKMAAFSLRWRGALWAGAWGLCGAGTALLLVVLIRAYSPRPSAPPAPGAWAQGSDQQRLAPAFSVRERQELKEGLKGKNKHNEDGKVRWQDWGGGERKEQAGEPPLSPPSAPPPAVAPAARLT